MNKNPDFWKSRLKEWTALDPLDRTSEWLFGLIMVLTFTSTISVATAGRQEVQKLLWAALSCNISWGLVDAIMNILSVYLDRERQVDQLQKFFHSVDTATRRAIIRNDLSPMISELTEDEDIDRMSAKLREFPEPSKKHVLTGKDFLISGQIFLLMFFSTFPVSLPFLIFKDVALAIRVSNGVAITLLFVGGYSLARYSGLKPWISALAFTAVGLLLISITIYLGG